MRRSDHPGFPFGPFRSGRALVSQALAGVIPSRVDGERSHDESPRRTGVRVWDNGLG